jgi:hypothetical protein
VGYAPKDLQFVVGALEPAAADSAGGGVVVVEDLGLPGDEGVDYVVELGQLAGLVQVAVAPEGRQGTLAVVGEVEPVELLQGSPSRAEAGVAAKTRLEAFGVGGAEGVGPAEQRETGPEDLRLEHRGDMASRLAPLQVSAHEREAGGEPAHDVKPVQHMSGVAQVAPHGGPIRLGTVGHDYPHTPAPAGAQAGEEA